MPATKMTKLASINRWARLRRLRYLVIHKRMRLSILFLVRLHYSSAMRIGQRANVQRIGWIRSDYSLNQRRTPMVAIRHERLRKQLSSNLTIRSGELILKRMLNQTTIDQVFHAFGDPTRRKLIEQLSHGPASVSDLAKPLDMTLAAVVQHLQVLERSGVVRTQKIGRVRTCRLEPGGLSVAADWIAARRALWERRLDRLGDMVAEEAQPTERAIKPQRAT
jgi:DNA-binding transcriptional ArsR family regulator